MLHPLESLPRPPRRKTWPLPWRVHTWTCISPRPHCAQLLIGAPPSAWSTLKSTDYVRMVLGCQGLAGAAGPGLGVEKPAAARGSVPTTASRGRPASELCSSACLAPKVLPVQGRRQGEPAGAGSSLSGGPEGRRAVRRRRSALPGRPACAWPPPRSPVHFKGGACPCPPSPPALGLQSSAREHLRSA